MPCALNRAKWKPKAQIYIVTSVGCHNFVGGALPRRMVVPSRVISSVTT